MKSFRRVLNSELGFIAVQLITICTLLSQANP